MTEHPQTRRARFAVGKVTSLEHKLFILQAELAAAKLEMLDEFRRCESLGLPLEPWENHWRVALDCPRATGHVYGEVRA